MELAKNDPTFAGPYEAKQQGIPGAKFAVHENPKTLLKC